MITLSNGYELEFVAASGALDYDGLGWIQERLIGLIRQRGERLFDPSLFSPFIKTIGLFPRAGNFRPWKPWDTIRFIEDGIVNAFGLRNPGFYNWAKKYGRRIKSSKTRVAGSIFGTPSEIKVLAECMNAFDFFALEINGFCPNLEGDKRSITEKFVLSCQNAHEASRHPLIAKVSAAQKNDLETIVRETEGLVEAYSINSVPWQMVFPDKPSPLEKYGGGGVSGKIAQSFTWPFAEELQSMTDVPVIAPSVWEYGDIEFLRDKGFKAFSFGSVFLRYPWRPTLYARRCLKQAQEKGETR